jgi:NADP-dependent 3-hydroxy acid dehydrogenase YdfG
MTTGSAGTLSGRTALVSGASRGIGLAVARVFASAGARVVMIARGSEALEAAANAIGAHAIPMVCDAADADAVQRVAADVPKLLGSAPDILVNNAGVFDLARIADTSPDVFERALAVNLVAPFLLIRALLPAMRARGSGHVISIGSIADRATFPENGAYAASKYGLRALHQVLRAEVQGSGVRVTLVSPGPVNTSIWDAVDPDSRPGFTPRAQMLAPESVADAVLYAATQPASVNVDELRLSRS